MYVMSTPNLMKLDKLHPHQHVLERGHLARNHKGLSGWIIFVSRHVGPPRGIGNGPPRGIGNGPGNRLGPFPVVLENGKSFETMKKN